MSKIASNSLPHVYQSEKQKHLFGNVSNLNSVIIGNLLGLMKEKRVGLHKLEVCSPSPAILLTASYSYSITPTDCIKLLTYSMSNWSAIKKKSRKWSWVTTVLTEYIAFPATRLLQNKSQFLFRLLIAFNVKLQQWEMFGFASAVN